MCCGGYRSSFQYPQSLENLHISLVPHNPEEVEKIREIVLQLLNEKEVSSAFVQAPETMINQVALSESRDIKEHIKLLNSILTNGVFIPLRASVEGVTTIGSADKGKNLTDNLHVNLIFQGREIFGSDRLKRR